MYGVENVDLSVVQDDFKSGFPWHSPEKERKLSIEGGDWWEMMAPKFSLLASQFGIEDQNLSRHIRNSILDPERWFIYEGVEDVLELILNSGGVNHILSNHIPELDVLIDNLGLINYFSTIHTSGKTGVEKPNAKSFEPLLESVEDLTMDNCLFIGDSVTADLQLADKLGIDFMLVNKNIKHDYPICCLERVGDVGKMLYAL